MLGESVTPIDRGRINRYSEQENLKIQPTLPAKFLVDGAFAISIYWSR
jgi:hypothetical protein